MKITERFDRAFEKLYNAFNKRELDAGNCEHCAVGNLCDNERDWADPVRYKFPTTEGLLAVEKTGYSVKELQNVESLFMWGILKGKSRLKWSYMDMSKETQFNGLIAVLNYLAELDGIESIETQYNRFKEVLERETINTL